MKRLMAKYVILTYLVFFVFIGIIGFVMFILKQETLGKILQIISAWTSTFVFLYLFKKIYPDDKILDYIKRQFSERIKISILFLTIGLMIILLIGNIITFGIYNNKILSELVILSPVTLVILFFSNIISGPLGEELGWRAFFLTELQKKHKIIKSGIITGILWGFWHAPLWFATTGFTGISLIVYCVSFMLAIISFSVIITILYNHNRNLIIPILGHQLFNYFLGIQKSELLLLLVVNAIILLIMALLLAMINNKIMNKS